MAPPIYAVSVPARACNLKMVRAFFQTALEAAGAGEVDRLLLALDEACANVVKHRSGPVDDGALCVQVEVDGDLLRFRVGRFCQAQDVPNIKPRDLADVRPGGLGTSFIAQIMDRVEFVPEAAQARFMALVMTRALRPEGSGR